jgi:SAM-dependent methyltransferase
VLVEKTQQRETDSGNRFIKGVAGQIDVTQPDMRGMAKISQRTPAAFEVLQEAVVFRIGFAIGLVHEPRSLFGCLPDSCRYCTRACMCCMLQLPDCTDRPHAGMTENDNTYNRKLDQELANYRNMEEVHYLPPIAGYWAANHLVPIARQFGFSTITQFYCDYIVKFRTASLPDGTMHILSIGAGNCDQEINIAGQLRESGHDNFVIECVDINPDMLDRGCKAAEAQDMTGHFRFVCTDITSLDFLGQPHVVIANQSLHHMLELELLFDRIAANLHPQGFFLTHDMIGRNGHQRWPEALRYVEQLWAGLPDRYKFNHQLKRVDRDFVNWDCSGEGFEGIRAQDILPLMVDRFEFDLFLAYGNLIDIFVDRGYGPNFSVDSPEDCRYIDNVHFMDQLLLELGDIKPTHVLAAMKLKGAGAVLKFHRNLSPAFCVRQPDQD